METRAGDPGAFARFDLGRVDSPAFVVDAAKLRDNCRILADVRDAAGWQQVVQACVERFGSLDVMWNIAGYLLPGYVTDVEPQVLDQHIDVNVKGVMYACRVGARQMIAQGRGQPQALQRRRIAAQLQLGFHRSR